jgi:hypothetical protein
MIILFFTNNNNKWVGLHFVRFYHKLIWSPWLSTGFAFTVIESGAHRLFVQQTWQIMQPIFSHWKSVINLAKCDGNLFDSFPALKYFWWRGERVFKVIESLARQTSLCTYVATESNGLIMYSKYVHLDFKPSQSLLTIFSYSDSPNKFVREANSTIVP